MLLAVSIAKLQAAYLIETRISVLAPGLYQSVKQIDAHYISKENMVMESAGREAFVTLQPHEKNYMEQLNCMVVSDHWIQ